MKIHLIYLDIDNMVNPRGDVHFGLASLSSVLKVEGHKVTFTHLKKEDKNTYVEKTINGVKRYGPDIIGFTLTELEERNFMELSHHLKDEFELPMIVGGAYPTIVPERIINTPGIDIVVRGEAENIMTRLLYNLERNKPINELRGIWSKENKKIYRNELDYPPDITTLPPMDFSIFDDETVLGGELDGNIKLGFICNRGCPFRCTYCLNHHLRHSYPKGSNYVRYQKVDKAIEELVDLKNKYKFDIFCFYDDIFLLNKKWVTEFTQKYKNEVDMPFICNARIETATKAIISMAAKADCKYLYVGIESGNEWIRKNVLDRRTTNEQVKAVFNMAKDNNIKTCAYNMVGIPNETEKNILETIRLNAMVKPHISNVSAFYPFRGTKLGELCYKNGWVIQEKKEDVKSFVEGSIVNYPQLSNDMINWYFKNFILLYYSKVDIRQFVKGALIRLSKHWNIYGKFRLQSRISGMGGKEGMVAQT